MTATTSTTPRSLGRARLATAVGALVFAALSPTVATAQDGDTVEDVVIVLEDGKERTFSGGKVASADYTTLVYDRGGRKQNVSAKDVLSIQWGDAISDYADAQRWLDSGNPEGAKAAFELCVTGNVAGEIRDWTLEYGNAGAGEAYLALAARNPDKRDDFLQRAAKAFADAQSANGKSMILDRILRGAASAAQAAGNTTGAIGAAQDLARAGTAASRPLWELEGKMLVADVHRTAGNHQQAASAYDAVQRFVDVAIASAREKHVVEALESGRRRAAAQQGWVLLEKALGSKAQSDFDAARRYFDSLKGKYGREPEVLAAAANATGVMAYHDEQYIQAVRSFETTEVLYYEVGDEVARSLYYQNQCFKKLEDAERAAAAAKDLREYFPRSEWARKLE